MGNAGAKLDETHLGPGSLHEEEGNSISAAFVSIGEGTTRIKSKGRAWVAADGAEAPLWTTRSVGVIRSHSVVEDPTGARPAIIVTVRKGLTSCTNHICRSVPSYDGQAPLTDRELTKAGIASGKGDDYVRVLLYPFARIEVKRKLSTAKCTYGIFTGDETFRSLYEGEKLPSLGFRAIFKEVASAGEDGTVVAKAFVPGMAMNPHVEASAGVDLLAIVSMGYALAGDGGGAGALAGAGAV